MEYQLDVGMWNQVFAVPCALVDRHLKLAGKEQLQVILWLLRHPGRSASPETLAQALGMTADSALDALEYWADQSLLTLSGNTLRPLPQPEERPAPAQEEPPKHSPPAESAQAPLPPRQRLIKPDAEHLTARLGESEGMRFLMQEAESILGKTLSPAMSAALLCATDDYGLPPEVTVMLLHYAKEVGRTATTYIDSVARDWAESGIFSIEAAEEKLRQLSSARLAWSRVQAAAGLLKRSPSKSEAERACRWINDWGFSDDMISAAYELCANNTGKFSAAYMDKTLTSWHEAGIKNTGQVQQLKENQQAEKAKRKAAQQVQRSYDTGELEQLGQLDLPEEL